jgi:hypothetical protein
MTIEQQQVTLQELQRLNDAIVLTVESIRRVLPHLQQQALLAQLGMGPMGQMQLMGGGYGQQHPLLQQLLGGGYGQQHPLLQQLLGGGYGQQHPLQQIFGAGQLGQPQYPLLQQLLAGGGYAPNPLQQILAQAQQPFGGFGSAGPWQTQPFASQFAGAPWQQLGQSPLVNLSRPF